MPEQVGRKQKLTLSVDKEVIEKARRLGINISEITEKILRGFTFSPTKVETGALYEKYEELFQAMLPLLQKYDASVEVGAQQDEHGIYPIFLDSNGEFTIPDLEDYSVKDARNFAVHNFYEPKEILSNFINSLSFHAERQKKKLTELEMARRIIDAISGTTSPQSFMDHDVKQKTIMPTNLILGAFKETGNHPMSMKQIKEVVHSHGISYSTAALYHTTLQLVKRGKLRCFKGPDGRLVFAPREARRAST